MKLCSRSDLANEWANQLAKTLQRQQLALTPLGARSE